MEHFRIAWVLNCIASVWFILCIKEVRFLKKGGQAASPMACDHLPSPGVWENLNSDDSGPRMFQRTWSLNAEVCKHRNGFILHLPCLLQRRELCGMNVGVYISRQEGRRRGFPWSAPQS